MKRIMLYLFLLAINCSVSAIKYPILTESSPEKAGSNAERLSQMGRQISQQVDVGYPSVNLLITKDDQIVYCKAWGTVKRYDGNVLMEQPVKATTGTLYGLVSNTEMYATNFAPQKLISGDKLCPDDRIAKHIPGLVDSPNDTIKGKSTLRVSNLLHHNGGLPADPQYPNKAVAGVLYSRGEGQTLEMIKRMPLEYRSGSKYIYSDVGYMLLGSAVKSVTGRPLDRCVEESIYRPLGLTHMVFNSLLKGSKPQQIAATELNSNTRDGMIHFPSIHTPTLRGQMYDEKAFYSMDGVSGYVGLFSNTNGIMVLMQATLNGGGYGDVQLLSAEMVKMFTVNSKEDATFGLGWRMSGNAIMTPTSGMLANPRTYGYTGWTGAVTVIDPVNRMTIVMLNNKPHLLVADPQKNPNMFESGQLPIVTYGWATDQVYTVLKQK